MITDETAFSLSFDALAYREKPLSVKIGNCLFSEKGIVLDIQKGNIRLKGVLRFHDLSPLGYDIMGSFAFVPFMQCRHRVYSMTHGVKGQITVGDQTFTFRNGTGYIEGDMGCSFPKEYIWTQCGFKNGSLMLSVADIPFLCHPFTGIVGVILLGEKKYRLATYLGASVSRIGKYAVTVKQGDLLFTARLLKKKAQPLLAPANGRMCRTIYESASCKAYYRFSCGDTVLCEFISDKASFEFEYHPHNEESP